MDTTIANNEATVPLWAKSEYKRGMNNVFHIVNINMYY